MDRRGDRLGSAPHGACPSSARAGRRLLFLTPFAPRHDADHGGGRVMASLIGRLAERHQVVLLCLRAPEDQPVDDHLQSRCVLVREFLRGPHPPSRGVGSRLRKWRKRMRSSFRWSPGWVTHCDVAALRASLPLIVRSFSPEIVQFEFHVMAQYAASLLVSGARRVLHQYEPGAAAARERWRAHGFRAGDLLEALAWHRYEHRVCRQMDAVVVLSEPDRQVMEAHCDRERLRVVAPGIDLPERPLHPRGLPPPRVLFVGNFLHPPNVDAAERLARSIFPRVLSRVPEARLCLVGADPSSSLVGMAGSSIEVTGRVTSVEPYLDQAAVFAAPLRLGGGLRIKVQEALAAGKAVVASARAVAGLALRDGQELIVAEGDEEFAAAITALLEDGDRRERLGRAGRFWAMKNLDWRPVVEAFEALYGELLSRPAERWPR